MTLEEVKGPFFSKIEDYTAVATGDVVLLGLNRWFNNCPGYGAAQAVNVIGDGSSTIAELVSRTRSFDVLDTTSGDIAATSPASPFDGQEWTVLNSGTGGFHVTGLPGSISLGDGKMITFRYVEAAGDWSYPDVIIDEVYTEIASDDYMIRTLYAGGNVVISGRVPATNSSDTRSFGITLAGPRSARATLLTGASAFAVIGNLSTTSITINKFNDAGAAVSLNAFWEVNSRWKALGT